MITANEARRLTVATYDEILAEDMREIEKLIRDAAARSVSFIVCSTGRAMLHGLTDQLQALGFNVSVSPMADDSGVVTFWIGW